MERNIYLDIDMDFFVAPIQKASVDNVRLYYDAPCGLTAAEPAVRHLKEQGLRWTRDNISCFTNHKTSYIHWWMSKKQNQLLIHIDAHSDMYRNTKSDLRLLHNGDLGCHNYIWYGIRDGYIGEVIWVIPDSLSYLLQEEQAQGIINSALIREKYTDSKGLHILMECIVISGESKLIPVHICTLAQLRDMEGSCAKVTIATSPEFIPEEADEFIFELFDAFDVPEGTAQNIYKQHKEMLKRTEEEIKAAWNKLKE